MKLDSTQISAVTHACSSRFSIITGGAGTGKTTIIRALVEVFRARRLRVALAAPTGRAAKRMEEATGHDAQRGAACGLAAAWKLRAVAPAEITMRHMYAGMVPFIGLQVVVLAMTLYWPQLVTWLPTVAMQLR
jgi:chloramphenicol 3-O-phosphotransferase